MVLILMVLPLLFWSTLIASIVCFIIFLVFAAKKRKKRGVGIASAVCFGAFLIILGILIALLASISTSAKSTRFAQDDRINGLPADVLLSAPVTSGQYEEVSIGFTVSI